MSVEKRAQEALGTLKAAVRYVPGLQLKNAETLEAAEFVELAFDFEDISFTGTLVLEKTSWRLSLRTPLLLPRLNSTEKKIYAAALERAFPYAAPYLTREMLQTRKTVSEGSLVSEDTLDASYLSPEGVALFWLAYDIADFVEAARELAEQPMSALVEKAAPLSPLTSFPLTSTGNVCGPTGCAVPEPVEETGAYDPSVDEGYDPLEDALWDSDAEDVSPPAEERTLSSAEAREVFKDDEDFLALLDAYPADSPEK